MLSDHKNYIVKGRFSDYQFLLLIFGTWLILLYFTFTIVSKGDEHYYIPAFNQALRAWPNLDFNALWSLSSIYLWVISTFHHLISLLFNIEVYHSARLLALISWLVLAIMLIKEGAAVYWKAAIILYNPYTLVYATRAHPLIPALLLAYLFWKEVQLRTKTWGLTLILAVTFQVFIGGITAMLLPKSVKHISFSSLKLPLLAAFFALCGVLLTWLTWQGVYPKAFMASDFFKTHHINGTLSLEYFPLGFMFTGGLMAIIGDRQLNDVFNNKKEVILISFLIILGAIYLYIGKPSVGVFDKFFETILPTTIANKLHIAFFSILGLGWLRVQKNKLALIYGVLGSATLMAVLPFFYERISVFSLLAPNLIWALLSSTKEDKINTKIISILCLCFLVCSILYQLYGAL